MLLTDYIIIQLGLDFMRRRNILDVKSRLLFLPRLFLFHPLFVRDSTLTLQIGKVHETDIGKALPAHILTQIIHESRIIQHPLIVKLADRIHCLMHTVITYRDVIGKFEHLPGFALRPAADKADILIVAFLLIIALNSRPTVLIFCFSSILFVDILLVKI